MNALDTTRFLKDINTFVIFDDFWGDQTDLFWVDHIPDTGTVTMDDAESGWALLDPSDASVADNDEVYLASANENFLVKANRSLYARFRVSYQEQNTNDANVVLGFMSAASGQANLMVDDGAGPRASGNLFVVEKRDGETEWRLTTRNGSAVDSTISTTTAGVTDDTASWQVIEIWVQQLDALNVQCVAAVDGKYLRDTSGNNLVIKHKRLIASSTEMNLMMGIKNGDTNNELLYVDYALGAQTR